MSKAGSSKDEKSINFRPSANFKHMKKYLKSKFKEDMNSGTPSPDDQNENMLNPDIQPPLPPNSPPPSPPRLILKEELVETDHPENNETFPAEDQTQPPGTTNEANTNDKEKFVMCKDFVRKTCTRGSACIFAHKIDFAQLKDVYKFCRDFENKRCNRPVCYFVHATTFEKEHFFRTAYLPPHVLAHLNMPTNPQPAVEAPPELSSPPPQPLPSSEPAGCQKREWREPPFGGPAAPKGEPKEGCACGRCGLAEIRLQHSKAQVSAALRSGQELDNKLEVVELSNSRVLTILCSLLDRYYQRKPHPQPPAPRLRALDAGGLLAGRLMLPDDCSKDVINSQIKMLLAQILLSSPETTPSEESP